MSPDSIGLGAGDAGTATDVVWPEHWWAGRALPLAAPFEPCCPNSIFHPMLGQHAWLRVLSAAPDEVRDLWCQAVVDALRRVRDRVDPGESPLISSSPSWRNTAGAWTGSWIDQKPTFPIWLTAWQRC